jgi:hypothetical protein
LISNDPEGRVFLDLTNIKGRYGFRRRRRRRRYVEEWELQLM